MGSFGLRG
jgi:NitT/TauT family transport system substrate-binding protein